jgi:hypothetical protein
MITISYQCLPEWLILEVNIANANVLMSRSIDLQLIEDLQLANAIRKEMLITYYN